MQMAWIPLGYIVLGILFFAIFAWRLQKARLLRFSDIVLLGFGFGALLEGLSELFKTAR